jgi:hypothetical protein
MGYITGTTSKTEQAQLALKANKAREALQDFWGAYVNGALAAVERQGAQAATERQVA